MILPLPCASAVRVIDMIGVMPLPPAKSSRSASSEAGVKMPDGGSTRIVEPSVRLSQIQLEA